MLECFIITDVYVFILFVNMMIKVKVWGGAGGIGSSGCETKSEQSRQMTGLEKTSQARIMYIGSYKTISRIRHRVKTRGQDDTEARTKPQLKWTKSSRTP